MDLGIGKKLNYDLYSNQERASQVQELFTEEIEQQAKLHFEEDSTRKELEKIANFILYGKDPKNDLNFCQKKEIQIDSAKPTFKRKEPESLDQLLENPATREDLLEPIQKNIYKKVKPTISRDPDDADAKIPGMRDLWNIIDRLERETKALKEQKLLNLDYYQKRHLLISLRQEQYVLKDYASEPIKCNNFLKSTPPPLCFTEDTGYLVDYDRESEYFEWKLKYYGDKYYRSKEYIAERRAFYKKHKGEWDWVELSRNVINFTDKNHIYQLIEAYSNLVERNWENLDADLKYLYWELEDYIEKANLNEARKLILVRKIDKVPNEQIRVELLKQMGLGYSENYISTIYMGICEKIAKAAELSFKEFRYRNDKDMWKTCSTCGERKLKDLYNFTKKKSSPDGLNSRCKICDKKAREAKALAKAKEK